MLLIATQEAALAQSWTKALSPEFALYEPFVKEYKALESILKKNQIEVLLLDFALLGPEGLKKIAELLTLQKDMNVVLFVDNYLPEEELSAIIFGAKAYCVKTLSPDILKKMMPKILEGQLWVDRKFVTRLLSSLAELTQAKHKEAVHLDSGYDSLTPREKEIANLVSSGYPNRKIANTLNISERTVKAHLGVIFRKLGITDRLQLALYVTKFMQMGRVWCGKPPG